MSNPKPGDAAYVLGQSERETQRLILQGQMYAHSTRSMFERAGLVAGMKVLDVGSGAGDVALTVAQVVGPQGQVIGVDKNPAVLATARARVAEQGHTNITFLEGDVRDVALDQDFDAVVGRNILLYLGDKAEVLRYLVRHLRSGGIVAFQEADFTIGPVGLPSSAIQQQIMTWWDQTARRAGLELSMGFKLRSTYLAAGLSEPQLHLDAVIGGGNDWAGYTYLVEAVRSFYPLMINYGIATPEEVDLETLEDRFRAEVVNNNGVVALFSHISAWARTPAA